MTRKILLKRYLIDTYYNFLYTDKEFVLFIVSMHIWYNGYKKKKLFNIDILLKLISDNINFLL